MLLSYMKQTCCKNILRSRHEQSPFSITFKKACQGTAIYVLCIIFCGTKAQIF